MDKKERVFKIFSELVDEAEKLKDFESNPVIIELLAELTNYYISFKEIYYSKRDDFFKESYVGVKKILDKLQVYLYTRKYYDDERYSKLIEKLEHLSLDFNIG